MGWLGEICASGASNDFSQSSETLINLRISRMSPFYYLLLALMR